MRGVSDRGCDRLVGGEAAFEGLGPLKVGDDVLLGGRLRGGVEYQHCGGDDGG